MSWREHASPIIARVLAETQGQDEKQIRKALRDAYPYGERKYHPYKIWCDEVKRQRGLKPKLGPKGFQPTPPDPRQVPMFEEP